MAAATAPHPVVWNIFKENTDQRAGDFSSDKRPEPARNIRARMTKNIVLWGAEMSWKFFFYQRVARLMRARVCVYRYTCELSATLLWI